MAVKQNLGQERGYVASAASPPSKTFIIVAISIAIILVLGIFVLVNFQSVGNALYALRTTTTDTTIKTLCTPKTAQEVCVGYGETPYIGKSCGSLSDGCGGTVSCGTCGDSSATKLYCSSNKCTTESSTKLVTNTDTSSSSIISGGEDNTLQKTSTTEEPAITDSETILVESTDTSSTIESESNNPDYTFQEVATEEQSSLPPLTPPCVLNTCIGEGFECGALEDGCGGYVDCGFCGSGEVCIVGGQCETPLSQVLPSAPLHDQTLLEKISAAMAGSSSKLSKLSALINAIAAWYQDPANQ